MRVLVESSVDQEVVDQEVLQKGKISLPCSSYSQVNRTTSELYLLPQPVV